MQGRLVKYLYLPEIPRLNSPAEKKNLVVVEWVKSEGDYFTKMEPVVYVRAVIGVVEVKAPESGTIHKILARRGSRVRVGQPLATFLPPGKGVIRRLIEGM